MKKLISILIASAMVLSMAVICAAEDEPEAFATVEALQFDIEPEIDGKVNVDEWGQPSVAHIKYPENPQTDVSKDDQTDVEFTIWFRYTYDGLYIAAQTPDSSPCNDNVDGAQIWNGDCLQMRLDPYGCTEDQGLFASAARDANYSDEYQEFAFAYSPDDGECYSYCWHGIMSGLALQSEGGKYGASNDGTTTTYELFIPWDELLEDAPHAGNSYGIAAALLTATQGENDNKWQNWLEWGSGVINNRDDNICGTNRLILSTSTVFGGATLTDPNPAGETTTRAPIPEAEGEYVPVDFTKLSSPHDIHFSQNDDGINDTFVIQGIENYADNRIRIFNRWGNKVYEASPYRNDWDGRNHEGGNVGSDKLPVGTYYYLLWLYKNDSPKKGYIYLNR